jgi:ABC-type transport system substrate-binding protein
MFKFFKTTIVLALISVFAISACTKKLDDKDNSLNLALAANVKGLDPIASNDFYSALVISNIFEGLLKYDYLKRPYELIPNLAESMPEVSSDGLTYKFKIKKGIKFQDHAVFADGKGREVKAEDFVYSWKRLADPRNQSDGFWIFDGKIIGLNEWADLVKLEKADYTTQVEGLKALDDYTLQIKLKAPYFQLYSVLAMPFSYVVAKEAVVKFGKELLNNPIGTGPYKLASWVRNSKIVMEKNPNFHEATYPSQGEAQDTAKNLLKSAGAKTPFADKLTFTELTEDQPRWQNFMKGNFDYLVIPNDNFDSVVKNDQVVPELAAKGFKLAISPSLDCSYVGINMKDAILGKNKLLRQAMALAYDAPTSIQKFLNGRGITAQGPIPPGMESYDINFKNPLQTHDLAKAKELLAKAGYPEGKGLPEFSFETVSDSKTRQQAEFFAQNMAEIGLKIKISANSWPQLQEKIKNSQAQLFRISWFADYPDPQNFFQLFYSKNASPGPNDTAFANADFDKLYEESLTYPSGDKRTAIYKKLRDIVVEESPWIFSAHTISYTLYQGWLNNYKPNEVSMDFMQYLDVDPKLRAELKTKL